MKVVSFLLLVVFTPVVMQAQTVQLSLNENAYGPAPAVTAAIQKELKLVNRYTGWEGDSLVAAIARREGVEKEQVITGEILELLGTYLGLKGGKGGEFIYSVPGYPALVNAAEKVGGVVVSVPLNDRLENDLPAITARINTKTQAIFLVNPHNPSGTASDKQAFYHFLHTASQQALVIVDEAYLEYSDDFAGRTAVAAIKAGDNVLVFRTFAKAHGLAGLSIGYAIAPKAVAVYLKAQGLGNTHDLNRLSVVAALAALGDTSYLARIHTTITKERSKWYAVLDQLGLKYSASQANFIFFDAGKPNAVVTAGLKQKDIITGRAFPPYDTWVRITIGLPEENAKAQKALRQVLGK